MFSLRDAESWKGKKVLVVGLSRSGLAAANLLADIGAQVFATDTAPEESLGSALGRLRRKGTQVETGGHTDEGLKDAEVVVISPGVPLDIPILKAARDKGLRVISELELGYSLFSGRIIAVTGTNGKTTVVNMINQILQTASIPAIMAGNVGEPLTGKFALEQQFEWAVVEVSSFQLETIERFQPHIAAVLNITPDHLDRHADFETYRRMKTRIMENQQPSDWVLLNADDPGSAPLFKLARSQVVPVSLKEIPEGGLGFRSGLLMSGLDEGRQVMMATYRLKLRGSFNIANSLFAAGCARLAGAAPEHVAGALSGFTGLEHRLEFVAEAGDIAYYNDSKATNIAAARQAIESFSEPLVVILGGRDKGSDFGQLLPMLKKHATAAVLIGEVAGRLAEVLEGVLPYMQVQSMDQAVRTARDIARPGQVVLLSPACASFDMFHNFEERGKAFKDAVNKII